MDEVEKVARAICLARGLSPDCLYQHQEWEKWPTDKRDEYTDLHGEKRVTLMHYGWRKWVPIAQAAIAALDAARGDPVARVVEWLRKENYRAFTDGMEAAAQICGSLAEVEYDDADGFEAATGCEAAIMRVVKDQRREQAALGASHDAEA